MYLNLSLSLSIYIYIYILCCICLCAVVAEVLWKFRGRRVRRCRWGISRALLSFESRVERRRKSWLAKTPQASTNIECSFCSY